MKDRHEPKATAFSHRGYLPHFHSAHGTYFVTFRLEGSLPSEVYQQWLHELASKPPRNRRLEVTRRVEEYLDEGHHVRYLARPDIARLVEDALLYFDKERYSLHAWVIMLNHVHTLLSLQGKHSLDSIIHSWKSYTGARANRILQTTGRFWAPGYYDRKIRDERHFKQVVWYIHKNPVSAGLCLDVDEFRWSSASRYPSFADCVRG